MTMDIIENNKLILDFLGYEPRPVSKSTYWKKGVKQGFQKLSDMIFFETIEFHKDWNLLMSIVEEIENLNYSIEIINIGRNNNKMSIFSGGALVVESRLIQNRINAVYSCVIDFIKWYNELFTKY